jgi:YHS domain-containing protein
MFRVSILIVLFLAGCAAEPVPSTQPIHASAQGHAECLVCKHNADLACVDLAVTDQTASATYNGRRYYFCSEDCKNEFEKHPGKYAP